MKVLNNNSSASKFSLMNMNFDNMAQNTRNMLQLFDNGSSTTN